MKKYLSILMPAILVFAQCTGNSTKSIVPVTQERPDTIWVDVLHWNDFHSANIPYKSNWGYTKGLMIGGYATLAGYIDSLKQLYPNALTLNAGDDFQGSPISALTRGMSQITILNAIKPTAFTIGNHEFDYGRENLRKAVDAADFNILSCNLYDSTAMGLFTAPYTIVESNGARIGIIGLIMADLKSTVLPANMVKMTTLDPAKTIMKYVNAINDKTDLIIVLSHNGFREDSVLATQLTDVDIIIGGHSHTRLKRPVPVNHILICQAGSRGQFLGHMRAKVNPETKTITDYNYELIETVVKNIKPDPVVAHIVDSLESAISKEMDRVIAQLQTDWVRNGRGESNIGDWIADATREYFNADIAFQNSGGIRKNLNKGPVLVRDIWEISPFDNTIVLVTVSGEQLLHILDWRIHNPRDLLQQSGLRRVYDMKTKTLVKASVNGKAIEKDQKYIIATNNYIVGHIDRFWGLSENDVKINDTGVIGRDILLRAAEQQKSIDSRIDERLIIR